MVLKKKNKCPTCNQTLKSKTSTAFDTGLSLQPRQTSDLFNSQVIIPFRRAVIFGAMCGTWGLALSWFVYIYLLSELSLVFWVTAICFLGGLTWYWSTDQTDYKNLVKPEQPQPMINLPPVKKSEKFNDFVQTNKSTWIRVSGDTKARNTFAHLALVERRNISRSDFCDTSKQVRMTATGYNKLYKQLTGAGVVVSIDNKNEVTRPGRAYLNQFLG